MVKKTKTSKDGGAKAVGDALSFDDKLTRRLPLQEATIELNADKSRPPLGIRMGNHPLGAIVRELEADGAAVAANLKRGDVIVSVDGIKVTSCHQAAETIKATVLKSLELAYYKAADAEGLLLKKRKPAKLCVLDLSATSAKAGLTLAEHPLGLLISCATDHAAKAGLKSGDVIATLAGRVVLHPVDAARIIAEYDASRVSDGTPLRLTVYPAKLASLELVLINVRYAHMNPRQRARTPPLSHKASCQIQ